MPWHSTGWPMAEPAGSSEAWADVVRGEDAAIYAYSVAGAQVPKSARDRALRGREEHLRLRDVAASLTGSADVVPAPAYDLGSEGEGPAAAKAVLARVEQALVAVYAQAAGASTAVERRLAARAATECAMRAVTWGAEPEAF